MKKSLLFLVFLCSAQLILRAQITRIYSDRYDYYISGAWVAQDSDHYTYSGTRGGVTPLPGIAAQGYDADSIYSWPDTSWQFSGKVTGTFDTSNRLLMDLSQTYLNSNLQNVERYYYSYNTAGDVLTYDFDSWDTATNNWLSYVADTSIYNAQNQEVIYISWGKAPPDEEYMLDHVDSSIYNVSGQLTDEFIYDWDTTYWILNTHSIFSYYNSGAKLSTLMENWSGTNWYVSTEDTLTYDGNGNQLSETILNWSDGNWKTSIQYLYTYDSNGSQTSWITNYPADDSVSWVPWELDTTVYDNNKNPILLTVEIFTGGVWKNSYQDVKTFNSDHEVLTEITSVWDSGVWAPGTETTYTYDVNNNATNVTDYNYQDGAWAPQSSNYYWYSEATGINEPGLKVPSVIYPNPGKEIFNVDFSAVAGGEGQLLLYDITGRLISSERITVTPGNNHITWYLPDIEKGCYLYQLNIPEGFSNGKVVTE